MPAETRPMPPQGWKTALWTPGASQEVVFGPARAFPIIPPVYAEKRDFSGHLKERSRTCYGACMTSFPDWVEPMAATLTQERFTGPEWIFERKYDGIRLLAFRQGADLRLFSRNRLPQSCPPIAESIGNLPVRDLILDGEVTWGRSGVLYHVFDI